MSIDKNYCCIILTMKKIFLVIFLLIITNLPVFAEYKPIPETLSKQYKKEMEQIINSEYKKTINNIDNHVKDAKRIRDKILKNGFNIDDYITLSLIPDTCITSADLDLYGKMLKVTQEKYLGMKYKPIGTDSVNPIDDILSPYFRDNNVNRMSRRNRNFDYIDDLTPRTATLTPKGTEELLSQPDDVIAKILAKHLQFVQKLDENCKKAENILNNAYYKVGQLLYKNGFKPENVDEIFSPISASEIGQKNVLTEYKALRELTGFKDAEMSHVNYLG